MTLAGRPRSLRSRLRLALLALIVVGLGATTAPRAFLGWHDLDDQGYFLVAVQGFLARGALYDETFSTYGAGSYLARGLVHGALGVPASHDGLRATLVAAWLAAAAAAGLITLRTTRSVALAALASLLVAALPPQFAFEAGHPRDLLALTVVVPLVAATGRRSACPRTAWLVGGACGLAVMTKVNVGGALVLAWALVYVAGTRAPDRWGAVRPCFLVLAAAAPWALLGRRLGDGGALRECLLLSGSIGLLGVALLARRPRRPALPTAWGGRALLGASGAVLAVAASTLATGTSLRGLVEGHLLRALRHAGLYFQPLQGSLASTAALLACSAAALAWVLARGPAPRGVALAARLGVVVPALVWWQRDPHQVLSWLLPWSWLALDLDRPGPARAWLPRAAVAGVGVLGALTIVPLACTHVVEAQLGLSLVLVSILQLGLRDGWRLIRPHAVGRPRLRAWYAAGVVAFVAGGALLAWAPAPGPAAAWRAYSSSWPLRQPGAERLRVELPIAAALGTLCETLRGHADGLVTWPGLGSLHAWTGLPPVTGDHVTAWMTLLDDAAQRRIVERLRERARPAAVVASRTAWVVGRDVSGSSLVRYVEDELRLWRTVGFEVRLPGRLATADLPLWLRRRPLRLSGRGDDGVAALWLPSPDQAGQARTLELWFELEGPGVLVATAGVDFGDGAACRPLVYVGADGRARTQLRAGPQAPLVTDRPVLGGRRHLAVTLDEAAERLFLDGALVGEASRRGAEVPRAYAVVLGGGAAEGWPEARGGWWSPRGVVHAVALHDRALAPAEVTARVAAVD